MRWNQQYSKEKMFNLITEHLSGGITQKELCNREGLKLGTFKYWQKKYRQEFNVTNDSKPSKKVKRSSNFITVSVPKSIESPSHKLALIYPNGVRLELDTLLDTKGLLVLKELVSCLD